MADIQLLLDEENTLKFEVEVQGVQANHVKSRFVIESEGMDMVFDGKFDNDAVTVKLPIMANMLEASDYKCRLEFIMDDRFFTPMETTLEAILPVKVRAGLKNKQQTKEQPKGYISVKKDKISVSQKDFDTKSDKFETKHMPMEVKELRKDGTFTGYGSIFNNVDAGNDIMSKGAFSRTLNSKRAIKLLWQHNPHEPIGIFTNMVEDEKGLLLEGKLAMDVQRGREAYSLMKMGAIDGLSIGYKTVQHKYDDKGIRHLNEVKLFEVSIVTFEMNDQATVTSLKSVLPGLEQSDQAMINNLITKLQSTDSIERHSDDLVIDQTEDSAGSHSPDEEKETNIRLEKLINSFTEEK